MIYAIVGLVIAIAAFIVFKKRKDKPEPILVAIMGDSIARRSKAQGELSNDSIQPELEANGRVRVVLNTGVGGATTEEIMNQLAEIRGSGATHVIVTGGINDILQGVPLDETIKRIRATDKSLKAAGKQVIRLKPHKCKWPEALENKRQSLNAQISGIIPATGTEHLIDNYHFKPRGKGKVIVAGQIHKAMGVG